MIRSRWGLLNLLKLIALAGLALFAPLAAQAAAYDDAVAAAAQRDFPRARELFAASAQAGDARAQFNLGRMYLTGEGGPQDYAQALKWSGLAADQGIPGAQSDLGRIYDQGLGVRRDPQLAATWYEKAAAQSFSSAQVSLGDMLAAGRGAPIDLKRAAELYGAAAIQGDADAQFKLATLSSRYDLGLSGVSPHARFSALMDSVFGPNRWRETGGFRTAKRENELRTLGALTVRQGAMSAHSLGKPEAPGAYDLVVDGLSPERAATKLRVSKAPLKVIFPEGAHGAEGPHLHVEPYSISFDAALQRKPADFDPAKLEDTANWLRTSAAQGHPGAQLWMGRLYLKPGASVTELALANLWFTRAASNPQADAETRKAAADALAKLRRPGKSMQIALGGACARSETTACEAPQRGQ
jgi:TPR repeat protein